MGLRRRKDRARGSAVTAEGWEGTRTVDGAEVAGGRQLVAGVPGRCAQCDGFGFIDHIDMRNRFQTQHCPDCGFKWEYSFDDQGVIIDLTDRADESAHR